MDTEKISKTDIAWLAGIIDGEGCIYARLNKHNKAHRIRKCRDNEIYVIRMGISITNTDVFLIKEVSRVCELLKVGFAFALGRDTTGGRGVLSIVIEGKGRCKKLLLHTLPYIINKKPQAEVLLKLIEYRESLGYFNTKNWTAKKQGRNFLEWIPPEDYKPLSEDPIINQYILELKELKKQTILPSETKRVANRMLQLPIR